MTYMAILACLIGLFAGTAQAEQPKAITGQEVAAAVSAALAAHGQQGTPILAAQRRYFPCETALTVAPRQKDRWDAVEVKCTGNLPWSIVVRTSADIPAGLDDDGHDTGETTKVLVLRRALRRGEVITAEKLDVAEVVGTPARGAFSETEVLVGRRMAQALGAGIPILERHLQMDWLVRENDPIVIETNAEGIVIGMSGIALEHGQLGDFIRVRNLRSGRELTGQVAEDKKIIVTSNIN
jgi:flagella basal body P-ring formation protein FlgA